MNSRLRYHVKMVDRWMTYFLEPMEMCHIKDCAARAETDSAEDTSGQTRQLHKAGRHQLTHQHSCRRPRTLCHCRTGRHAERIATAREQVLPSLPPATLAQCAMLAFSHCMRSQPRGGTPQQAHACSRSFRHWTSSCTVIDCPDTQRTLPPRRARS